MLIADPATGELVPAAEGPTATLYVCGITPYDATHLGHAATYVAFDLLHRAWLDQGLTVRYASNVTDVDDPLLDRAETLALFAERGGDPDRPGKRDPLDPALWRRERPGEPAWDGDTLGSGRPGWHIECTVIAQSALGEEFDVAGGGRDLCFPHHMMSADHARALGGRGARAHMHVGMVAYEGEKMSKSLGNLVLVSRLVADGVEPAAIRLAILAHHYATDWEFTHDLLDEAGDRLRRWRTALSGNGGPDAGPTLAAMRAALARDLDAPAALRAVDEWATAALTLGGSVEGAPGVLARAIDALLGVRI